MVSNFGGDGGDVLVDPADGCNIVQEYVYLSMRVTKTCANPGPDHPNAFLDLSQSTTTDISPPDVNAQFIAPFTADRTSLSSSLRPMNSVDRDGMVHTRPTGTSCDRGRRRPAKACASNISS